MGGGGSRVAIRLAPSHTDILLLRTRSFTCSQQLVCPLSSLHVGCSPFHHHGMCPLHTMYDSSFIPIHPHPHRYTSHPCTFTPRIWSLSFISIAAMYLRTPLALFQCKAPCLSRTRIHTLSLSLPVADPLCANLCLAENTCWAWPVLQAWEDIGPRPQRDGPTFRFHPILVSRWPNPDVGCTSKARQAE